MNGYWRKKFEETVGKTVGNFSDGAERLKQNWNERPLPSEPGSIVNSSAQSSDSEAKEKDRSQYLRLPVESARKLRWYDREEIDSLVESSTKDKQLLQSTIAALRQTLKDNGTNEADLKEDLRTKLREAADLAEQDEAIASVLLVSAQQEVRELRAQLEGSQSQLSTRPQHREDPQGMSTHDNVVKLQINIIEERSEGNNGARDHANSQADADNGDNNLSEADTPSLSPRADDDVKTALLGKLGRVEEERREYYEEMVRLSDLLHTQDTAVKASEQKVHDLEATLSNFREESTAQVEALARREQELRDRMASSQERHAEILRRAQDICLESEDRANQFEKRCKEADAQLKDSEVKRQKLEERASQAEAALESKQREVMVNGTATMREAESKSRIKIDMLEREISSLQGELQQAQTEIERLEGRLAAAEEVESKMSQHLQAAESALADQDQMEAQLTALREQIEENKGEQGKLSNYKKIAAGLEADRDRLEEEVVATVRIATNLETRLQAANQARQKAENLSVAAEARAREAELRVDKEVARRLEVIGADEMLWPSAARDALKRQTNKLENMHVVLTGLQNELDSEQHTVAALQATNQTLQNQLRAAESRTQNQELDFRETRRQLESKIATLQVEIRDWQREVAFMESEASQRGAMQRKGSGSSFRPPASPALSSSRGGGGLNAPARENGQDRPVDLLYLKNVLLKFVLSASSGNHEQCRMLLPAVATLLHANSHEFRALKNAVESAASWWPQT